MEFLVRTLKIVRTMNYARSKISIVYSKGQRKRFQLKRVPFVQFSFVAARARKWQGKGGWQIRWSNYTHHGTQVVIANEFNGFSVCLACDRAVCS